MPKADFKTLEEYREYIKKRLAELTPILQKISMGDFSSEIYIPKQEDEFSELLAGLSLMIDDLQELEKERKKAEEEKQGRINELEKWRKITVGRELTMADLKKEIIRLKKELAKLKNNHAVFSP